MKGSKNGFGLLAFLLALTAAFFIVAGCNDSNEESVPGYGGSIPKGDYVTAEINESQITIKNYQESTMDTTLGFGGVPAGEDFGSSIIHLTDFDVDGNYYLMALVEDRVLALHKMDSELNPLSAELPVYMFEKTSLTAADLKGRAFNFMELFAGSEGRLFVEVGIIGFDTDPAGRLYGAADDSEEDAVYSITNGEDDIFNTDDDLTLDKAETIDDGSLVIWENGTGNWQDATTLTGSTTGPVVLDHGPGEVAGGGAGFAFPQVPADMSADEFWETVTGDYFLIAHYTETDNGIAESDYLRCYAEQKNPGEWDGMLYLSFDLAIDPSEKGGADISMTIIPLDEDTAAIKDIEEKAAFSNAESEAVQNATQGRGLFLGDEDASDSTSSRDVSDFTIAFDPDGNYIMGVKSADPDGTDYFSPVTGFGLGIRDRNWQKSESSQSVE